MKRKLTSAAAVFGILVMILVCFPMAGCAQGISVEWDKTFGGADYEYVHSVQQTQDGGYIIAGMISTSSLGEGMEGWLIKTDSEGNKLWDKTFGGTGFGSAQSAQQTQDRGYIIAGMTGSSEAGIYVWLLKSDSEGNKVWDKTYGRTDYNWGYSVQQTQDRGYVIAGMTIISSEAEDYDVCLIKTDSEGNKSWDKTFGGSGIDAGVSVQQTQDGGYIIAGLTESFGAGETDVWLIKTDSSGHKKWDKTFGGLEADAGFSVQQTKGGGYIIVGITGSYGAGLDDIWLIKTN